LKTVGIVIPCYNESRSLRDLIEKCQSISNPRVKFLILDNGSTDDTINVLNQLTIPFNIDVMHLKDNRGYGFGIFEGLKTLDTDYVGWTHADFQTDPSDVLYFLPCIDGGVDFMKGKRTGRPLVDRFFTAGMSFITSLIFIRVVKDVNGQPTIFNKELLKYWNNPPKDFALDLYAYLIAIRTGCSIERKSVHFGPRKWGNSHWNTGLFARARFIKRTLKCALRLRLEMK
jgi:glycosyltransferase involved in cell wall biosynthesis